MKKRILLVLGAMLAILAGGIWFAAEESYVLNIKATLSTALDVNPAGDWNIGVVYAQQKYDAPLTVGLSASAKADPNLSSVAYEIGCQKPNSIGNGTSASGPVSLCPYISLVGQSSGLPSLNLTEKDNAFVSGSIALTLGTNNHDWLIQIDPPTCIAQKKADPPKQLPVAGSCDPGQPLFMAATVYVELFSVNQKEKVPCDKDGQTPECLPDLVVVITSAIYTGPTSAGATQFGVTTTETCTIYWTVTNQANQKEAKAGASVTHVGTTASTHNDNPTDPLQPGATFDGQTVLAGNCDGANAEADAHDDVKENDEFNNTYVFSSNNLSP